MIGTCYGRGAIVIVVVLAAAVLTFGGEADAAKKSGKKANGVACHQCVNSKSIKNNAVTTGKIKNNSITGKKLRNGSVTTNKLANGSVTASKLAPGAVLMPENIVYVSPSGGDYPDPQAARTDLASWCGTPSASNRCLIKILPGIYNLGGTAFQMTQFVSVEGSGTDVTILTGTIAGANTGVVRGANNSGLRHLTVSNTGEGTIHNAIYGYYMSSFEVRDVKLTSAGASTNQAVYFEGSGPILTDVVATATGGNHSYGIYLNLTSNAILTRVSATVSGGASSNYAVNATLQSGTLAIRDSNLNAPGAAGIGLLAVTNSATVSVRDSIVTGGNYAIYSPSPSGDTVHVSRSELDGSVHPTSAGYICAFNVDGSFAALDTDCQ